MYLKRLKFIIGLGFFAVSLVTSAERKPQQVTQSTATSQQKLSALINNYQKICLSDKCKDQLIQLRKFGRWGDAKSQLVVASAYLYGDGFEQDTEKSINWFKRVAYNNSPDAVSTH